MYLTASAFALWTLTVILEGLLCAVVVQRRLWQRLPLFSSYVLFKFLVTTGLWLVYRRFGYDSNSALYFFWSTQSLLLVSRAGVCAELCWLAFKSRAGLCVDVRKVLIAIATAILVYAAIDAYRQVSVLRGFVVTSERSLELSIAIFLTSFLIIANRYRIPIERSSFLIAVGVCLHSAFQVLNNTFFKTWLDPYFSWWRNAYMVSFQVALLIFLVALRRPLPETKPIPTLLPRDTYHSYSRLIGQRLKDLGRDIQEVMKP